MKKRMRPGQAAQRSAPKSARQRPEPGKARAQRAIQSLAIKSILVPIDFSVHS